MKSIYSLLIFFLIINLNPIYAQNSDINLLKTINLNRNRSFDKPFEFISNITTPLAIGIPISLFTYSLIKKDKEAEKKAIIIGTSIVAEEGITLVLKYAINRPRPYITYPFIDNVITDSDPTFPSGHTGAAFATATSLSLAYPKWYIIAPSFLYAGAVGYSRLHLGLHYPTDVLGGIIVGMGSSYLTYKLGKRLRLAEGNGSK